MPQYKVRPPRLRKGSTIFVTAPSSYPVYPDMRLAEGIELLRKMGYRVVIGETLRYALRTWFYSAPPDKRVEELNNAFRDPGIDAVFCARGGVGSLRLLDKLDYDAIRENPKILVGYSDSTALQEAILLKAGMPSLQAAMPGPRPHVYFGEEDREKVYRRSLELAFKIMEGEELTLSNPPDAPMPKTINPGRASGTSIGGNIIIHVFLLAAGYAPSHEGAVLFLENIAEHAWRIDDYMSALELGGYLSEISAMVLGEFPEPKQYPAPSPSIEEVLATRIRSATRAPAFMNYSCCHSRYILPYPIGVELEVNADEGAIVMKEPLAE